jgi:cob(I)alamin adenosyltransferase
MTPRVYTRAGDRGMTSRLDGERVPKTDPQIEAYGTVDELQAALGAVEGALARVEGAWVVDLRQDLSQVQERLFALCAHLSDPQGKVLHRVGLAEADVVWLEQRIDTWLDGMPPQTRFVRPGGSLEQGLLNLARTVCRRAERRVLALPPEGYPEVGLRYLNRLSDFLFVAARWALHSQGVEERYF